MAVFPYAYRKVLVGSGVIKTTGSTLDLNPGDLALVDAKTFKALSPAQSTYSQHREVLLAQGSFHTKDVLALGHGGYKESVKSRPINGHFITNFRLAEPKRAKNHVVTIGYDGVDTNKTITAKADEDYFLRIDLKGEPVYRYANHQLYNVFHVKAPCPADACADTCGELVDANIIADDFVSQINAHPYIKNFLKAEKIVSCNPAIPAPVDNVAHLLYNLTLCDTGDQAALAAVAGQYPTRKVVRSARNGSLSTYEICQPTADAAPASYLPSKQRIVPNCASCPTGFTFNAQLYKIEVLKIDAGDATALTAAQTAYSATAGVRVNYERGTSTYVLYLTTAAVPAPVGTDKVIDLNEVESSVCVETATPTAIAWVAGAARYKTARTLELTVSKTCGGANRLADIRLAYTSVAASLVGGTAGITVKTAGDCADVYTVRQLNKDCLLDPCGGKDMPEFDTLQSFEGIAWEVPEPVPADPIPNCSVGIRLTGAYIETKFGDCSFEPTDHYELDMVRIYPSQLLDSGDRCEEHWPVTELQAPNYASGTGESVRRELIQYLEYRQEPYLCDVRMRETQDLEPVLQAIDRNKFYKIYYLTYNVPYTNNSTNMYNNEQYELMVVFEETVDTKPFENLINAYTASIGIQLQAL